MQFVCKSWSLRIVRRKWNITENWKFTKQNFDLRKWTNRGFNLIRICPFLSPERVIDRRQREHQCGWGRSPGRPGRWQRWPQSRWAIRERQPRRQRWWLLEGNTEHCWQLTSSGVFRRHQEIHFINAEKCKETSTMRHPTPFRLKDGMLLLSFWKICQKDLYNVNDAGFTCRWHEVCLIVQIFKHGL